MTPSNILDLIRHLVEHNALTLTEERTEDDGTLVRTYESVNDESHVSQLVISILPRETRDSPGEAYDPEGHLNKYAI